MLAQLVFSLNAAANVAGRFLLAPVAWLPGWLSATVIGVTTGILMLVVFKYTSNQAAIKGTRNQLKANMLALSLFKDSLAVSLKCQGRLLAGAVRLLGLSLVPLAVLTVPMVMMLGQLALWFQVRPLEIGEESIVTVQLKAGANTELDHITLKSSDAIQLVAGPVRVPGRQSVCWNVKPLGPGRSELQFAIGTDVFTKEMMVGDAFLPTSVKRPARSWKEMLIHPREPPFDEDSIVQSIEVAYPEREAFTSGTNRWMIYWFLVSMAAALAVKPLLNVNI